MILRRHQSGQTRSEALFSGCGAYRYLLSRRWGDGEVMLFVLLNPSTATEERNDPTVERCERRARAMGWGGFAVANIFAFRATDPRLLKQAPEPVGQDTDAVLSDAAAGAGLVLCGWGAHGAHLGRGAEVEARLRSAGTCLWHLGLTRENHPRHPLYQPYSASPQRWL